MSVEKLSAQLVAALLDEARKEVSEASRASALEIRNLRQKLKSMTAQRDKEKARCSELRSHIARYQAEIVKLRGK